MKTLSPELKAEYAKGSTTISRQWRFERTDGLVRCVTTCARDLLINGEVYLSKDGLIPTTVAQSADGSVDNSEANGVLSPDFATEAEIIAGLWDKAKITIFEVNYRDLSMGQMILQTGTIGEVKVGRSAFTAEIRSLSQSLNLVNGYTYTPHCLADLGDERCKVDVEALRHFGTITQVTNRRDFTDSANAEPDDWFGAGVLRIESGENQGAQMEIYSFESGHFVLALPFPFNLTVGIDYSVLPGCRKRHERGARNPSGVSDCVDKFNNLPNFRGFPPALFPGNNRILGLGSKSS